MRPVLDSGYVATPPPPPPPPPPHTVKSGETVQSVAKHYNVTPQSLASTNHIQVDAPLHAGQVLNVPSPEYYTAAAPVADEQPTQTPQQKTDAAAKAYEQAIKDRDTALRNAPHNMGIRSEILQEENAKVSRARSGFDAAVQAEVNHDVTQAKANALKQYQSIPPQIRRAEQMSAPTVDTNKVVQQATADIQTRLGGDPAAKAEVQNAAHAYQVKTTADSLIPYYADSVSAADKLKGIDLKGQPQEVIDAVLADPRVQQWIKQAAADVGKPYDGMKSDKIPFAQGQATQAAANLALATQGMSPELATALTQASMPTLQDIAKLQLGYAGSMVPFNTVQSVLTSLGNGSQAQAVIQQVASAYADNPGAVGFLTRGGANSELASNLVNSPGYGPAGNPAFAIALGDELQDRGQTTNAKAAFDAAAQGVHDYLANNGGSPLKAYESAHKAAQEKDSHLAELLDKAGPLTTQQRQDFIKAYRADPENAKVYKADAEAAKNLAAWMNANKSGLLFAAGRNSGAAQQLYGMMKDLTTSGQGVTALQFMADIKNDPAASKAFSQFSDYQTTFRGDALVAAQGQLLLSANGDPKSAAAQLLELAEPVFKGTEGWNLVKENYQRLASGETTAFNAAQFAEGYKEMGAVGKSWAIASIMTSTFNGANAEQINSMIGAFATAGANVDGLGTGAVQALADAGKLGRYTESAEAFAKFSSKFIPGLAVVVSTTAFASDFGKATKGNPAYAIALAGDVFSVVGSVIETIPGGQVPGAIVNGIGVVLSAPFELIGSIIDGNKEQKEFQEEQVKYLEAAGIGKDEAELLAKDGDSANLLAKQLDLTPGQTQKLLEDHPEVFDEGEGTQYAQAIADLVKASGVQPGDVDGFLTALATDSQKNFGDPTAYVRNFYNMYVQHRNNGAQDRFTYGDGLISQVLQGGYDSAKAYLQQHSPDVAGPDGDARRQADSQFQEAMSAGIYSPTSIVNLINDNKSPAYQAQIVKDLQQNGMLDGWVRDMATSYGGINNGLAAAKNAIQAAQDAGVLSPGQAQTYLAELG